MEPLEIFRIVATEFSDIPDEDEVDVITGEVTKRGIMTFMELYKDQISERRFGRTYNKALAYLTAHKLKMAGYGEDSGLGTIGDSIRLASVSEGETTVSFWRSAASNLDVDGEYGLTIYGIEFLALRRNAIIPIISAGEAKVEY